MIDIRVEHSLGLAGAVARFAQLAAQKGITTATSDGGHSGTLEKQLPFVGAVKGRFRVTEATIEIDVDQAPPFPGPETIRRLVGEELAKALG